MFTEENKNVVRRFYAVNDAFSTGKDVSAETEELLAANARHHASGTVMDNAGFFQFVGVFASGFPGYHHTIEDQLAEGDKVATRVTWSGTHTENFQGLPPTGKQVSISGTSIMHITDGKIVEHWADFDALGLMQQLGAIPTQG